MTTALARRRVASRATFVLLTGLLVAACAQQPDSAADTVPASGAEASITASGAWVRQPPPSAAVAGGYLTLRNDGGSDDRLLSLRTDAAERVEIHEMQMADGMMRMRELADGLALPAGAETVLAPGGNHLMLINPQQPLEPGSTVSATLTFAHAEPMTVTFDVRPLSGQPAHPGH